MEADMATRVKTPMKACHECWSNFTLAEWDELQPASEHQPDPGAPDLEARHCSKCGAVLTLDRAGIDELDLTDDAAEYERHHPDADRVTADMVAPLAKEAAEPATVVATQPAAPTLPAHTRQQVLLASLRRLSPNVLHGIWLWMGRLPKEADGATLGELRALRGRLLR